ncbi:hypothetical protein HHL25_22265 [Rhizobium sp. S-51]|uniref:DUF35 domain-containing protein n=1 Tax=Rhizobium terricola TaxID=2728849 RepID=A0A7Y0B0K2_9HYPH|nr:hypothetical protein [Rhizobium terricola]NML76870.1 hypothetical protein [Rhizobium terricola]
MTVAAHSKPTLPPELMAQYHVEPDGRVLLRAVRSARGGEVLFPPRQFSGPDLAPTEELLLSGDGRVNCLTRVRVRPPYELPPGYMIGFVDLDAAPLRLFGLFDGETELSPGSRVALRLRAIGVDNDGNPCLRPIFVPASGNSKEGTAP